MSRLRKKQPMTNGRPHNKKQKISGKPMCPVASTSPWKMRQKQMKATTSLSIRRPKRPAYQTRHAQLSTLPQVSTNYRASKDRRHRGLCLGSGHCRTKRFQQSAAQACQAESRRSEPVSSGEGLPAPGFSERSSVPPSTWANSIGLSLGSLH